MGWKLDLKLVNDLGELTRLQDEVRILANEADADEDSVFAVSLALDEMATNVISYAYPRNEPHSFHVRIDLDEVCWRIQLEDDGPPFNPLDRPAPNLNVPLEERSIGGLGVHFVRQTMDCVSYCRHNGRNCVTMTRRRLNGRDPNRADVMRQGVEAVELAQSKQGASVVLSIKGHLDANSAPELERLLLEQIDAGERRLVLDCSELAFVSSAGLRALLLAARRIKPLGGQIRLAGMSKNVKQVFDVAGLSFHFEIFPTREAALA